tara:strand:- start:496 stop:1854 length:1359 start_codon:yes stop_codon:yes gene_type:complete
MKLIKSVSGIRGIYNKSLTLEKITKYAYAFSIIQQQKQFPILIARDSRISGEEITSYLINFFNKIDRQIINCGIIPTPTAQLIIDKFQICGGIIITASHNPQEWNGMKFIDDDGTFLDKDKNHKMFKIADNFDANTIKEKKRNIKISNYPESIEYHINNVLNISFINQTSIINKKFKIILDTINGAACFGFKKLLESLNCEVIAINNNPNGIFPRNPEPKLENLTEISKLVLKYSADLGLVTDPDGDRLAIIDNKGNIVIEENTLVLCVEEFLNKTKTNKPVVTNLSTTSAIEDITEKYNVAVIRSAVGEINVVNKMKNCNSLIGGEGNGGVILSESHYGRDAFVASIIILNHLATNNITMHEAQQKIPKYYMLKEKIEIDNQLTPIIISEKIKQHFRNFTFDETDGIKVINENFWIHIRQSNTEPIIRIYIESKIEKDLSNLFNKVKEIFN